MIMHYISDLVGELPDGCEPILYAGGILILFFLLCQLFAFLRGIFRSLSDV